VSAFPNQRRAALIATQLVQTPILCGFLLLGFGHATGAPEPNFVLRIRCLAVEVFLPQDSRYFSLDLRMSTPHSLQTPVEERLLIKFFGDEYVKYRSRVGTKIPFVP
jgi:protein-S-isoprenylcysteine O-methyltransferase Ste14